MTQLLTAVAIGMGAALAALVTTIVIRRFLSDRGRQREQSMRPAVEVAVVEYLAAEESELPRFAAGSGDILQMVALEMIAELHGRERDRLVTLLERSGVVAETAVGLGSRRRRVRRSAAEALRQIGSEEAVELLSTSLLDRDLDTRLTCAAALAELSDEELAPAILAIADSTASDRPGAVAAILVTLGRRHPSALGAALALDASPEVRRLAAAVVGELRLAEHVDALRRALESEDDELTARAARGLGMIGDDGALYRLLELLDDKDRIWFVRLAATDALGVIGDQRAVELLEHELNSDGWLLQAKAAKSLRLLGGEGEGALQRALDSPLETVRDHARVALER
jgi:HEAT repeat protein